MIFMRSSVRNLGLLNNTLIDFESGELLEDLNENLNEDLNEDLNENLNENLNEDFGPESVNNQVSLFIINFRGRTFYYFNEEPPDKKTVLTEYQVDNLETCGNFLSCPICMEDSHENIKLPCNHVFCAQCIKKWLLKNKNTCPNCRNNVM